MGEHDVRTETDGPHVDILIVSKEPHPHYDKDMLINDVAVLTMELDVIFNDRIKPICLPTVDPTIQNKNFVKSTPFVGT